MYIIRNIETGKYVARSGSLRSYTSRLEDARTYVTRSHAEKDRCPSNEAVYSVTDMLSPPK